MMERSALAGEGGEGGGCTPAHLSAYYHDVQSCIVLYTPAERADTLPYFISTLIVIVIGLIKRNVQSRLL